MPKQVDSSLPEGFTFHDLRHTGNALASATGANIRELRRRMGHATMCAALIYQHGALDRDREIAKAIEASVKKTKEKKPKKIKTPSQTRTKLRQRTHKHCMITPRGHNAEAEAQSACPSTKCA